MIWKINVLMILLNCKQIHVHFSVYMYFKILIGRIIMCI